LRRYSNEKRAEWDEPEPQAEERDDPYAVQRQILLHQLYGDPAPDGYVAPPEPLPSPLPDEVMLIIASVELARDQALLTSFSRFLLDGGRCYYLFPKASPRPDHLHACGGTGCWYNAATIRHYRDIARHFGLIERSIGNAVVFLSLDFTGEVLGPDPPPPPTPRSRQRFRG
jgi:hypothetical protein